jgi:hypothetical protein
MVVGVEFEREKLHLNYIIFLSYQSNSLITNKLNNASLSREKIMIVG